jgi:hypothetical protein
MIGLFSPILDGDDDSHHAISGCHDYAVLLGFAGRSME